MPADGMPAVGSIPGLDGVSLAVMHSAATLGPMIGRLLAEELLNQTPNPLLETFRPARFTAQ